ncbi:MAG TPA: hypothetical protein PLO23_03305 [Alphaproteobacteria bacterium]|nr:hypothetical protein [Alphaproteobacteria bacterium]
MGASSAFAQPVTGANIIAWNISDSMAYLPALVTGLGYLFAIVLGVTGIIKLKEHIENPSGTKITAGITRLMAGAMLFALPSIMEAMANAIAGNNGSGGGFGIFAQGSSDTMGSVAGGGPDAGINMLLGNVVYSIDLIPALITGVAYLLGLLLAYAAIIKIKEHVENPEQTKIHEGIIRLVVGGALFSLPAIYEAMYTTMTGGDMGLSGSLAGAIGGNGGLGGFFESNVAAAGDLQCGGASSFSTFGAYTCNLVLYAAAFPSFLNAVSYLFGLVLGLWALLKIRDHVLDPRSTPIWDGASKLIAGGAFFSLPYVVELMVETVTGGDFMGAAGNTFNEDGSAGCAPAGLDVAMYCFMQDVLGPMHSILNFFTFVVGIGFIMIGIGRLMKNAQDGAKGPGGIGTLMTFLTGGILISFNTVLSAFTESIFGAPTVMTFAELRYTNGLSTDEVKHAHTVISAIVKFMIVVGLISFVRGWFILRDVAEGNGQASKMAAITHIIGGALAVNLGPLLNAVQETLGIASIGLTFS